MDLPKNLLASIAIGVGITATALVSCTETDTELWHKESCVENCAIDHSKEPARPSYQCECPACGMG